MASQWNIQIVTGHFNAFLLKYSKTERISMWYVSIFIDLQLAIYKMKEKKSRFQKCGQFVSKRNMKYSEKSNIWVRPSCCFLFASEWKATKKKKILWFAGRLWFLTGFKFGLRLKQHQRHYILRWDYTVSFAAIAGLNLAKHLRTRGTAAMSAPSHFAIKCIFILHYIFIVYWILLIL